MAYPIRKPKSDIPIQKIHENLPEGMMERFRDQPMEQILVEMADMKKVEIAGGLVQAAIANDPSALKILQAILEKQGGGLEKELPITDVQFKEIIRIAAMELAGS